MAEMPAPSVAKDLIARLPRTFGPSWNQQVKQWPLLFPAEQRQLSAQLDWLARLPAAGFQRLFAPIFELESRMELPRWEPGSVGLSVHDVGVLARSPLYPQWRIEVEKVFARINDAVEESSTTPPLRRLVLCVLPAGLPLSGPALWPELQKQGAVLPLKESFGGMLPDFAASLAGRARPGGQEPVESTWIFECGGQFSKLADAGSAVVLSWTALDAARREFLTRLNTISRTLRSVDQTQEDLKRLDLGRLLPLSIGRNLRVREFVRGVLLSGNGSLVFNNSFVQWGASEALRRVQPQVTIAIFGIRPKLKPFSSTVLFEDQSRSNPAPDEDDPAGSLTDSVILAEYVHLAARRIPAFENRTMTLLAACDLERVLMLGTKPPASTTEPMDLPGLTSFATAWLQSA